MIDPAAAVLWGSISIESSGDDGTRSHVLLEADAAYTPIF